MFLISSVPHAYTLDNNNSIAIQVHTAITVYACTIAIAIVATSRMVLKRSERHYLII